MDIKLYREHIRMLAQARNGDPVYNGSAEHATIIVEQMFASANQCVRLLTGDLNAKVYGNSRVVQRAREFLGHSDHKLQVAVENDTFNASHPLIEEIGRDANVEFYRIPAELSQRIPYHFMTADEDCYRFEEEKDSHTAVAAFGSPSATSNLNRIFASIVDRSQRIDMAALPN